jgi:hypothetical protein
MKNALMLVLAFVVVYVVWHIVMSLIGGLIGTLISLALLALFCYSVYAVYKMLTREKQIM